MIIEIIIKDKPVKELLEKQNSFCETKDLADDWVSLQ